MYAAKESDAYSDGQNGKKADRIVWFFPICQTSESLNNFDTLPTLCKCFVGKAVGDLLTLPVQLGFPKLATGHDQA